MDMGSPESRREPNEQKDACTLPPVHDLKMSGLELRQPSCHHEARAGRGACPTQRKESREQESEKASCRALPIMNIRVCSSMLFYQSILIDAVCCIEYDFLSLLVEGLYKGLTQETCVNLP